jgi:hypothetical protein
MEDTMTNIEPPSGMADLNGQVNSIEADRAQLEREKAELEAEKALIRQRRFQEDQPQIIQPTGEPSPVRTETPRPYTPAVVDSDGEEYEVDIDTGEVILDGFGKPIPKWKHATVELDGELIQVRKPQPAALQAFSMAASKYTPDEIKVQMMTLFVQRHISPLSYQRMLERMMNPDDNFTVDDFGRVIEKIATLDTARPIEPSRP